MSNLYLAIMFIIIGWALLRSYDLVLENLGKRFLSYLLMVPIAFVEIYVLGIFFLYIYGLIFSY